MISRAWKLFATAYLLLIFGVYPFYMKQGYVDIGEGKYWFFLYCSMGALAIFLLLGLVVCIERSIRHTKVRRKISSTDLFVCTYLAAASISGLCSDFSKEAFWGTSGWRMGLVLWLVLGILYLVLSRWWDGRSVVFYAAMAASGIVFLLGILDSFSVYLIPLKVREPGFISTLGNINWFCGYLSVVGTLGVSFCFFMEDTLQGEKHQAGEYGTEVYLSEERRAGRLCHFIRKTGYVFYVLLTFMAGFSQGSSSVFLWFGSLFLVLFWIAADNRVWMKKWFMLVVLWCVAALFSGLIRQIFPGKYNYETNNLCGWFTNSLFPLWIMTAALVCWGILHFRKEKGIPGAGGIRKLAVTIPAAGVLIWIVLSVLNTWGSFGGFLDSGLFLWDSSWGNGRGAAMEAGFTTFAEIPFGKKLIGVGPDCFSAAAYSIDKVAVSLRGYFGSSRLTNAHCELLTSLVNVGTLGTICYLGIFLSFMVRAFKKGAAGQPVLYVPAICLFCYLCHNLVSFAQVLNLPFAFLLLAMGERMLRESDTDAEC